MNNKMIDYPLFHAVASQENCDGPEYDLMMDAAEYIRDLEKNVDFLYGEAIRREEYISNIHCGTCS